MIKKLTGICEMFVIGSILSGQSIVTSGIHKAQLM